MTDVATRIELNLAAKLRDPKYRHAFFLAETSRLIAKQLIALRKRRGYTQADLAKLTDTGQPAISRVESADYRNWSFNTLRKIAEKLDARLRIYVEASEDVLSEYDEAALAGKFGHRSAATDRVQTQYVSGFRLGSIMEQAPSTSPFEKPDLQHFQIEPDNSRYQPTRGMPTAFRNLSEHLGIA